MLLCMHSTNRTNIVGSPHKNLIVVCDFLYYLSKYEYQNHKLSKLPNPNRAINILSIWFRTNLYAFACAPSDGSSSCKPYCSHSHRIDALSAHFVPNLHHRLRYTPQPQHLVSHPLHHRFRPQSPADRSPSSWTDDDDASTKMPEPGSSRSDAVPRKQPPPDWTRSPNGLFDGTCRWVMGSGICWQLMAAGGS